MKLSHNVKQNGTTGIIGIVIVILNLLIYGGGAIEYADTIELEALGDIASMLDAADKDIVPVEFQYDGLISSTAKISLMGGLDLSTRAGDVLIFRKDNDVWIEVGRYLVEEN